MDEETMWELIAFVKLSKIRMGIIQNLKQESRFPSELVKLLDVDFPTLSKNVTQLKKRGIIVCRTPKLKKGRLYSLTDIGEFIIENMPKS